MAPRVSKAAKKPSRKGARRPVRKATPTKKRPAAVRARRIAAAARLIAPRLVLPTLRKHMLVDGFDIVIDLKKSRGSYIVDAQDGKRYLDFFTFVASSPLGLNHPKLTTPEFLEKLAYVAVNKPSLSDIYTQEQAEFVETFARVAMPSYLPHAFFIEGGALGNRERAEGGVRLEDPEELREGVPGRAGTAGDPLPAVLPRTDRLHALADEHGSGEDRPLPEVRLAARAQSGDALPAERGEPRPGRAEEEMSPQSDQAGVPRQPG